MLRDYTEHRYQEELERFKRFESAEHMAILNLRAEGNYRPTPSEVWEEMKEIASTQ